MGGGPFEKYNYATNIAWHSADFAPHSCCLPLDEDPNLSANVQLDKRTRTGRTREMISQSQSY